MEDVIKIDQIHVHLALLKLNSPNSSCKHTLEKKVIPCFTSKPTENTAGVNIEPPRESSVFSDKLIPTSKPKDESMFWCVALEPNSIMPLHNCSLVSDELKNF